MPCKSRNCDPVPRLIIDIWLELTNPVASLVEVTGFVVTVDSESFWDSREVAEDFESHIVPVTLI